MGRFRTARGAVAFVLVATAAFAVGPVGDASAQRTPKLDNGVGTEAALENPNCDPETGRIRLYSVFRVPCAKDIDAKDNGGATSRGVTRDSIKLVMVSGADPNSVPKDPAIAAINGVNQATKMTGTYADAVRDAKQLYDSVYETYGRDIEIEVYTRTGIDEASMRADALAIAEMKPFAVLSAEPLVGQLLADRKIVSIDFPRDPAVVAEQAPFRWSYGTDYFGLTLMAAEVLGKQLWGENAQWAGDESMRTKERKFGLVYPSASDAIPYPDLALFEKTLKKYGGGTIATKVEYTGAVGADTATIDGLNQQAALPIIAKLKDAGVTTVVLITSQSMTKALTNAATTQDFRPEWFCAEWFNCSFDYYARQNDQAQWSHAFGIGSLYPALEGDALDNYAKMFQWYYGPDQGTPSAAVLSYLNNFYAGIHMAGPKLTPKTWQAGLYARPAMGGAVEGAVASVVNDYGPRKGMAYPAFSSSGTDAGLWWWNPDVEGNSNIFRVSGKGKAMWVDGGKRYLPGDFPDDTPFFDESRAIAFAPATADDQLRPPYDCPGCLGEGASS